MVIDRSQAALVSLLFAMLFPGTILYYVALTYHLMPPLGVGYFGIICVVALLVLIPMRVIKVIQEGKIEVVEFFYFAFLVFFGLIVLWNGLANKAGTMEWHLISILQSLAVYLLCKQVFFRTDGFVKALVICWLAASVCILSITVDGRFILRAMADDVGQIPSYQTFALCYFIASVFVVGCIRNRSLRIVVHVLALACLYVNSARSEFAGYVFFAGLLEFLSYRKKSIPVFIGVAFVGLCSVALMAGVVSIPESRIATLVDLKDDNSSNERDRMAQLGLHKIMESPVIGAYGDYEEGGYIHNVLSVWQETGFLGAIFFVLLIFSPLAAGILKLVYGRGAFESNIALSFLASTILLLIVGKYFTYLLLPAALAAYVASKRVSY